MSILLSNYSTLCFYRAIYRIKITQQQSVHPPVIYIPIVYCRLLTLKLKEKTDRVQSVLYAAHFGNDSTKSNDIEDKKKKPLKQTVLKGPSYADKALCKQAHWFIYSKACPPISTFRDPKFLEMLAAMVPPDSNYKGKPPILTIPKLKRYVDAEYELMKTEIHK